MRSSTREVRADWSGGFSNWSGDAGIPRPLLQKVFRADGRTVARVDAFFSGNPIVELAGHATHSSRRERQHDAERHTELTIRGFRVVTFTFEDVRDRPEGGVAKLRGAMIRAV